MTVLKPAGSEGHRAAAREEWVAWSVAGVLVVSEFFVAGVAGAFIGVVVAFLGIAVMAMRRDQAVTRTELLTAIIDLDAVATASSARDAC